MVEIIICPTCCCRYVPFRYCAPLYVQSHPRSRSHSVLLLCAVAFYLGPFYPHSISHPIHCTGSPNPQPVYIGTEAVFYRARTYYHSSLPSLLLLPHIPIQCGVRTPCQAATQPVWYPYRITQLVFTLRDYGNFIVGLMEFFNTPELFVNYNWIISALFAEFPTNGYTRQTQGVVVLVMWEDDIISAFRHPGG